MNPERAGAGKLLSPFERFVAAIARVPKPELDAEQAKHDAEPRIKRGPKPKKPAA